MNKKMPSNLTKNIYTILYNNWHNRDTLYKQFLFFFFALKAQILKVQGIISIKKG